LDLDSNLNLELKHLHLDRRKDLFRSLPLQVPSLYPQVSISIVFKVSERVEKRERERKCDSLPVASSSRPCFLPLLIAKRASSNNSNAPNTDPTTAPAIPPFESAELFLGFGEIEPGEEIEERGAVEIGLVGIEEELEEFRADVEESELLSVEEPLKKGIEENEEGKAEMVENCPKPLVAVGAVVCVGAFS
jgi:hypothetical protein